MSGYEHPTFPFVRPRDMDGPRRRYRVAVVGAGPVGLTAALDLFMTHEGPMHVLGGKRCKRFAAFYDDGVLKALHVSEGPDDPAGDNDPSASLVTGMLPVL